MGNHNVNDPTQAYYVGLMNSCGYGKKELNKPVIGIVNSYTDANPGHKPLRELAQHVAEGVWAAGGTPAEFNVPAPCDGMAQGLGMHYILPSRDLIAGAAECMARAHDFDGLVFLCSCDKIVPGMLMAAASLDKPCLFLTAGCMVPYDDGEHVYVTPDLKESIGAFKAEKITSEEFSNFKKNICHSCGTCSMYGTANTMGVFSEVIGLTPFDSTTTLFCSAEKVRQGARRRRTFGRARAARHALLRHRDEGVARKRPAPRLGDRRLYQRAAPRLRARQRNGRRADTQGI